MDKDMKALRAKYGKGIPPHAREELKRIAKEAMAGAHYHIEWHGPQTMKPMASVIGHGAAEPRSFSMTWDGARWNKWM